MGSNAPKDRLRRLRLFFAALAVVVLFFASVSVIGQIRKFQEIRRYEDRIQYLQRMTPHLRALQDERDASLWHMSFPKQKYPKLLISRTRAKTDQSFEELNRFLWSRSTWKKHHEIQAFLSSYSHLANLRMALDERRVAPRELSEAYRDLIDSLRHTATGMHQGAPLPSMESIADNFRELLWLMDIRSMERSLLLRLRPGGSSYNRSIEQLQNLRGRLQEHLRRYWLHRGDSIQADTSTLVDTTLEKEYEKNRMRLGRMMKISDSARQEWWELSQRYLEELSRLSGELLGKLRMMNDGELTRQRLFLLLVLTMLIAALLLILWGYRAGVRRLFPSSKRSAPPLDPPVDPINAVSRKPLHPARDALLERGEFLDLLFESFRQARSDDKIHALLYLSFLSSKSLTPVMESEHLREILRRLQTLKTPSLHLCTLEPGTVAVLLCELKERRSDAIKELSLFIKEIETLFQNPLGEGKKRRKVQPVIGVKLFPNNEIRWEQILTHAASALERAKSHPEELFCLYDDYMDLESKRFLHLKEEFAQALRNKELVLHYQPRVDLSSSRIVGMEALIRWKHPHRGVIQPSEFLYLSSGSSLAWELDQYVLQEVTGQVLRWKQRFEKFDLKISMNLSGYSLQHSGALAWTLEYLERHRELAGQLEFEISQETLFEDLEKTTEAIETCKALGVAFCLDNFGTGYASMEYLKRLPVDIVKIDRSFILDLPDRHNEEVVRLMIKTAEVFGLETVAEGVERRQTLEFLREAGCTYYQGFHCTAPLSPEEIERFLIHKSRCSSDLGE